MRCAGQLAFGNQALHSRNRLSSISDNGYVSLYWYVSLGREIDTLFQFPFVEQEKRVRSAKKQWLWQES